MDSFYPLGTDRSYPHFILKDDEAKVSLLKKQD